MNRHTVSRASLALGSLAMVVALTIACSSAPAVETARAPLPPTVDLAASRRAAFADRYLAVADPLNLRVRELARRVDRVTDLAAMRAISLAYADVEDDFAAGLRSLTAPDDVRAMVEAGIAAAERVAAANRRAAAGDDVGSVAPVLSAALDDQRVALSRLRAALGIGPLPGAGDESE